MFRQIFALTLLLLSACASTAPGARVPVSTLPVDSSRVYDVSEVTTKPQLSNRAAVARALETNYANAARTAEAEGTVTLRLAIDTQGVPGSITVVRSTNPDFNRAAINVIRSMRFTPAMLNGMSVAVRIELPVTFSPSP